MKKFGMAMLMALLVLLVTMFAIPLQANAALVLADEGATQILGTFLRSVTTGDVKLHLYCTNVTPNASGTDTVSTYTECTGGGYAAVTLTRGTNWTISGNAPTEAAYLEQTFTFTGALTTNTTIYGYYVTDSGSTVLIWSELLGSTFVPANNGDNVKITPKFQMSKGTPN